MKKPDITYKGVFAVLFSLVILFFFISISALAVNNLVFRNYSEEMLKAMKAETDYSETAAAGTDWSKIYPFKEDASAEIKPAEEPAQEEISGNAKPAVKPEEKSFISGLIKAYSDRVENYKSGIDYYTSNLLVFRMNFIEINAKFNKMIGMKLITGENNVLVMADGNLTYYPLPCDLAESVNKLTSLSDFSKEKGSEFVYIQLPSKVDPENNYLPDGITDYDNIKADDMLSRLRKNGVNCLDIRKKMKEQGISYTESFYRTDHHWKTGTGFWAANEISKQLADFGIDYKPELLAESSYTETVYEKYMLGSLGRQVTLAYTDPEDFSVYLPDFETDFTVNYYDSGVRKGSFKDSLMNMSVFDKIDYYNVSTYASYLYGVSPIVSIENNKADNDKRILFVCDSFSHCVIPYVATQVRYIDKLDLRYFYGSVKTFIEKTDPDIVIVMYYPGTIAESTDVAMNFR